MPICKTTNIVVAVRAFKDIVREFISRSNSPNKQLLRLVVGRRSSQISFYYGTPKRNSVLSCRLLYQGNQKMSSSSPSGKPSISEKLV